MLLTLHLDTYDFWFGILVCCASMILAVWWMFRHLRRYRLITDTPTAMIRSAPQGYVEIIGHVVVGEGRLLNAPLSGKPCVWFRYRVDKESGGRKNRWKPEHQGTSREWFQIDDGTGVCWIDPSKAEIDAVEHRVWYGNTPHPTALRPKTHFFNTPIFKSRYRYIETLILEHERVYALGTFETQGGGRGVASLEQWQAKIIRDWKANYAELLARFGSPSEQTLNPVQWTHVREAARQAALEQRQLAMTTPEKHLLSNPNLPGHPLLVSTQDEERLAARFRLRAVLCLSYLLAALWFCAELLSAYVD